MTQTTPENLDDLVPPPAEPAAVDEGQVRRKSIMSGMWNGIKRGLLWGGVAGVGLTTLGTVLAFSVGGVALKAGTAAAAASPGWLLAIGKIPKVGPIIATTLGAAGLAFGANTAANFSFSGLALTALSTFGRLALPVVGGALAAGALIGATWGAISGYMESDNKVEQEHRKANQVAAQLNFERKRVMQEILQERELERQFNEQSLAMETGIGNFRSPTTPQQNPAEKGQDAPPRSWS